MKQRLILVNTFKRFLHKPIDFPCLDKNVERESSLDEGPEPNYEKVVSGYNIYQHQKPLKLTYSSQLNEFQIAYETWGTLNKAKDNVILLHTGLSGSSHAKSHDKNKNPGWWEAFIGPDKSIDTNRFFVICCNVLGGCYGSTGPSSIDPQTNTRYGTRFPFISVFDMVRTQFCLLDVLGISKVYASVGASMGGMQSLAAAALYPDRISKVISISAAARSHPYSIALRHAQRQGFFIYMKKRNSNLVVLMSDPNWRRGFYYDNGVLPHVGLKLARMIGTVTYRSGPEWELRFGRKKASTNRSPLFCADFLIETYLDHQGENFCLKFDPNSFLYISQAMDLFDMAHVPNFDEIDTSCPAKSFSENRDAFQDELTDYKHISKLIIGLSPIQMPTLILGVQSDILFPIWQQKEIADCLKEAGNKSVTYYELDAMYGHDTFLIDVQTVGNAVRGHLENGL